MSEAVESVLSQSITDFELIIVNDGAASVPFYEDNRVRVLDNAQRGAVPARNFGVTSARGTYVAFLDDDDVWIDRDHLQLAARALDAGADLSFADGIMRFPGEAMPREFTQDASVFSLEKDNTILVSAVCYRRGLHDTLGAFDESLPYYWDWDWYLRVARSNFRLQHLAFNVVDIRIHPHNMSGSGNADLRSMNLKSFADKHKIGPLELKNHADFAVH